MNFPILKRSTLIFFISLSLLLGCKTQLAPEYDKAIVEDVTTLSDQTLTFFAEVKNGSDQSAFDSKVDKYNTLIGSFEALAVQAKARPVPNNIATNKIKDLLGPENSESLSSEYPSAFAFEKIAQTFEKMKESHSGNNLTATEVAAFKNQVKTYLDQAITYESFLKR